MPPLRDRAEDIPLLVWTFLDEFPSRMGKKITQVPLKTMDALQRLRWPGNVRELRNVIEHGVIITTGDTLRIPMLEGSPRAVEPRQTPAGSEREHIPRTLERTGWRIKGPKGAGYSAAGAHGRRPGVCRSFVKLPEALISRNINPKNSLHPFSSWRCPVLRPATVACSLRMNHLRPIGSTINRPGTERAYRTLMVIGTLRIPLSQDRRVKVIEVLRSIQGRVLAQPGCEVCQIYEDEGREPAALLVERWNSEAAFQEHIRSEAYRRILGAIELSGSPPEVHFDYVSATEGMELIERLRNLGAHLEESDGPLRPLPAAHKRRKNHH